MTDAVVLRRVRPVDPGRAVGAPMTILLEGDRIRAVGRAADAEAAITAVPAANSLELDGLLVSPGYVDIQVNGAAGHDLTHDPTSIWAVGEALAASGVTAFVPTIVTAPQGTAERLLAVLAAGPPDGFVGAHPIGLHVEGPFLSPRRNGAHDPALLRDPDRAFTAGWSRDAGVVMATIAPELPGALDLIRDLVERGIVVSLGHSAASLEEGRAGIEAGATYATHLFNAMPGLGHRDPGMIAALLADPRVTVGTIPDTIHVHPAMLDLAWRLVGPDRFSIVTDAIAALGMAHGRYLLGGFEVVVDETGPRLPDGRLAGSVLTLDLAVRNLAAATGCSLETAIAAVTTVPARLLGLADRARIETGAHADLTILTPELEVVATIVGGRLAWTRERLSVVPT